MVGLHLHLASVFPQMKHALMFVSFLMGARGCLLLLLLLFFTAAAAELFFFETTEHRRLMLLRKEDAPSERVGRGGESEIFRTSKVNIIPHIQAYV
jgi:hypothetical protein